MSATLLQNYTPKDRVGSSPLIVFSQEYVLRAIVDACDGKTVDDAQIQEEVSKKVISIKRSLAFFDIVQIAYPIPPATWWHRYLILQPNQSTMKRRSPSYINLLHSVLCQDSSGIIFDVQSAAHLATGEIIDGRPNSSQPTSDPIVCLARMLQRTRSRNVVVVDGTDSALLVTLIEEVHRRETGFRVYLSTSLYPNPCIAIEGLEVKLRNDYSLYTTIEWSNFLTCLPLFIHAGIPPLMLFQSDSQDADLVPFVDAVKKVRTSIRVGEGIDCLAFKIVLEHLVSIEKTAAHRIREACTRMRIETAVNADWSQFRIEYYRLSPSIENIARTRSIAYFSAFIQLLSVYEGLLPPVLSESNFRFVDAPLVEDLLAIVNEILDKHQFISIPAQPMTHVESTTGRRTFNRFFPMYVGHTC